MLAPMGARGAAVLSPADAERLHGFPVGWTDYLGAADLRCPGSGDADALRIVSLFTGCGGLDLAADLALRRRRGLPIRHVLLLERERWLRSGLLPLRFPGARVVGELRSSPGSAKRGLSSEARAALRSHRGCDLFFAGWPCTPYSRASRRAVARLGRHHREWVLPELVEAIEVCRPFGGLLENVPTVMNFPDFEELITKLGRCGYDVSWQVIPSSAAGAWYQRARIWIAFWTRGERLRRPSRRVEMDLMGWDEWLQWEGERHALNKLSREEARHHRLARKRVAAIGGSVAVPIATAVVTEVANAFFTGGARPEHGPGSSRGLRVIEDPRLEELERYLDWVGGWRAGA